MRAFLSSRFRFIVYLTILFAWFFWGSYGVLDAPYIGF